MNSCIYCKKNFETYKCEVECDLCEEGTIECEAEFGDGYEYKTCHDCNGKSVYTINETSFCSETCRMEYFEDQIEY